VPGKTDVK